MNQVGAAAQPKLGRQEAEVILARDHVGSGCDVHEYVHVRSTDAGVAESRACRRQRQIPVVDAAVGPAALAPPPELIVETALVDTEVLHHPLRLEKPAVRPGRTEIAEDLLIRDPVIRQVRPDAND